MSETPNADETIVKTVRERYGRIAATGGGCGCGCSSNAGTTPGDMTRAIGYDGRQLAEIPAEADLGLGCGAPIEALTLEPGETVLDLGSGGGLDAFLAARRVGPTGRVLGVDMTPEMIERARAAAARGGFDRVEFRLGRLESLPIEDATIDAVTSNCVINLVPDKARVFAEAARVLRPRGRMAISDIVLDAPLPPAVERDVLAYVGCVAGAMLRGPYFDAIRAAGFDEPEIVRDVDYLETLREAAPSDLQELLERTGAAEEDLRGRVRSITWRAQKR